MTTSTEGFRRVMDAIAMVRTEFNIHFIAIEGDEEDIAAAIRVNGSECIYQTNRVLRR